jgi:hypothetical protein
MSGWWAISEDAIRQVTFVPEMREKIDLAPARRVRDGGSRPLAPRREICPRLRAVVPPF